MFHRNDLFWGHGGSNEVQMKRALFLMMLSILDEKDFRLSTGLMPMGFPVVFDHFFLFESRAYAWQGCMILPSNDCIQQLDYSGHKWVPYHPYAIHYICVMYWWWKRHIYPTRLNVCFWEKKTGWFNDNPLVQLGERKRKPY